MAGTVIDVQIRADIADLRAKLKTAGDITEAEFRDASRTLSKLQRQIEKQAKTTQVAARATRDATMATKSATGATISMSRASSALALQLPDVVSQLSAGAPAMQVFTQQGLQVVQQLDVMAVAAKAARFAVSPFALAIVAAGTAAVVAANNISQARESLSVYTKTLEDADAATRSLSRSHTALKLATGDVAGFVGDLEIQTALLTGEISQSDIAAGQLGNKLADTLRPRLMQAGKALAENEVKIQTLRRSMTSGVLTVTEYAEANQQLTAALGARDGLQSNLDQIKALGDRARGAIQANADTIDVMAASAGAAAPKLREMTEEMVAALQLSDLGDIGIAIDTGVFSEGFIPDLIEVETRMRAVGDAFDHLGERSAEESAAIASAYGTMSSQIAGATSDAAFTIANAFADSNKQAARTAITVAKAAAITQVAIDTALAVSAINANWSWLPPAAAALTAGAVAVGAAQAGAIAAQGVSFHSGGIAGGSTKPDEVPATLLRGEPVLTRQAGAMLGESGVNALNRGQAPGMGTINLVAQYGIRTYDAVTYDARRNPTTQLNKALRGRTKVGGHV